MNESSKHRKAFDVYFRLGAGRSLEELHRTLVYTPDLIGLSRPPSRSTIDTWSSAFHWQDRLVDLERQAKQQDTEDQVRLLSEMNQRHVKEGLALQQKGIERLNNLKPDEMPVSDAIRAVLEGARLERLVRGEPTEHIKQEGVTLHGQADLTAFTNEDLRRLAKLAERSARRARPA